MDKNFSRFTDDNKVDIIRQLNYAFRDKEDEETSSTVAKYDAGTGIYYADEEEAKKKVVQPVKIDFEKIKEIKRKEQMQRNQKTEHSLKGIAMTKETKGTWHSV